MGTGSARGGGGGLGTTAQGLGVGWGGFRLPDDGDGRSFGLGRNVSRNAVPVSERDGFVSGCGADGLVLVVICSWVMSTRRRRGGGSCVSSVHLRFFFF